MKIALVGYGAMGRMVAGEAEKAGHSVVARIDPQASEATHSELNFLAVSDADVIIDFSLPQVALANVAFYCANNVNAVVGTTGWTDQVGSVEKQVRASRARFLWSSNFSIGVHAYFALVEKAAQLFKELNQYDVWGYEVHHRNKVDSPSGTAKTVASLITNHMPRKSTPVYEKLERKLESHEFHFGSVRGGEANFEHTLAFDSGPDTIYIKHSARNRSGYAQGALLAAQWLLKQEPGFYGIEDLIRHVLR